MRTRHRNICIADRFDFVGVHRRYDAIKDLVDQAQHRHNLNRLRLSADFGESLNVRLVDCYCFEFYWFVALFTVIIVSSQQQQRKLPFIISY